MALKIIISKFKFPKSFKHTNLYHRNFNLSKLNKLKSY